MTCQGDIIIHSAAGRRMEIKSISFNTAVIAASVAFIIFGVNLSVSVAWWLISKIQIRQEVLKMRAG